MKITTPIGTIELTSFAEHCILDTGRDDATHATDAHASLASSIADCPADWARDFSRVGEDRARELYLHGFAMGPERRRN